MAEFSIWVEVKDLDPYCSRSCVQTLPIEHFEGFSCEGSVIYALVPGMEFEIFDGATVDGANVSAEVLEKTFRTLRSALSKKVKQYRSASYDLTLKEDLTFLRVIDLNDLVKKIATGFIEKENPQILSEKFSDGGEA